ncbi:MAG: penicillin-binding protein 2 [Syntrophobacteraceae bacterium]
MKKLSASPFSKGSKKSPENLLLVNWEAAEASVFQKQIMIIGGVLLLFAIAYMFRLWHLQVLQGAKYRYQSENNRIRLEDTPAPRGVIYDCNGAPLVENRPAYHLLLIREDVQDMDQTIAMLAELCNRSPEELYAIVDSHKQEPKFMPFRLLPDIDRDCLARIEAHRLRLPGVVVQLEPKREYRWNGVASHLVGYLSEITESELKSSVYQGYMAGESVGKVGVERAFEKFLHGKRGGREVEVDAIGRRIRLIDEVLPVPGRDLWLTVDMDLQRVAEDCLKDKVGAIAAVDPKTGAVLALASSPTFDQEQFVRGLTKDEWNALRNDPVHPLLNRAIGAAYPPGSTYKPIVALAALSDGVMKPENTVGCPGYFPFAGRNYRCWREHGHGAVNMHQALVMSCDVYFYQVGMRLGVDRIAYYASMFGLGEKTGIGLHAEHPGLIPTSWWKKQAIGVPWQKGETISISIGQGFDLATPLQMAVVYATIANGGKLWQPYIIKRIEGNSVEETSEEKGKLKRQIPIDQHSFDVVEKGLLGVVDEDRGTGHGIKTSAYQIAGKSGTAQVVAIAQGANRKQAARMLRDKEKDHAWFVAYAPFDDPRISVAVLIEHGGHGASAAAPLAKRVISAYLEEKGIIKPES